MQGAGAKSRWKSVVAQARFGTGPLLLRNGVVQAGNRAGSSGALIRRLAVMVGATMRARTGRAGRTRARAADGRWRDIVRMFWVTDKVSRSCCIVATTSGHPSTGRHPRTVGGPPLSRGTGGRLVRPSLERTQDQRAPRLNDADGIRMQPLRRPAAGFAGCRIRWPDADSASRRYGARYAAGLPAPQGPDAARGSARSGGPAAY